MDGIDPETLLEWLQSGAGEDREIQLTALEQLCMLLLMSDNIDRCFESCPPRTFLPALCRIFLDATAPDNILEVTARAITYYLDVSNECTRRITQVEGAVKAICNRLAAAEMSDRSNKDLAEQCVKLLEHVCQRETLAVYDAGGIQAMLTLVRKHGKDIHKDTMYSAMSVVTRLCGKMEPSEQALAQCAESLGVLLGHDDPKVSESALRCFAALTDRFIKKSMDPVQLAKHSNLIDHLLYSLYASETSSTSFTSIVLSLLSNLCRGSSEITQYVFSNDNLFHALFAVLNSKDERSVTDGLRLADLLVVLLCEGRDSLPKNCPVADSGISSAVGSGERTQRHLIDAIRQKQTQTLIDAIESKSVDVNYTDDVGQTLLNWAAAFGTPEMVMFLCARGADVNTGSKSSSLHYAACFGRAEIVKLLLQHGANPDLRDEDGKTALDKARERSDGDQAQVVAILESPSVYMHTTPKTEDSSSTSTEQSSGADVPDQFLAAYVLRKLVPMFCEVFKKSLSNNVRRSSLALLRKSVGYMTTDKLQAIPAHSDDPEEGQSFSEALVGVLVNVLDQEEDMEAQEQVLLIISSLLRKDGGFWVEELVRLGVIEKVELLAKESATVSTSKEVPALEPVEAVEDVASRNVVSHRPTSPIMSFEEFFFGETKSPSENTTVTNIVLSSRGPRVVDQFETADEAQARNSVLSRSSSSTPTILFEDYVYGGRPIVSERDRSIMLNVPLSTEEDPAATQTPPPTVELVAEQIMRNVKERQREPKETKESVPKSQNINAGVLYRWKEWRLARDGECLFLWADPLAIEFPLNSAGWIHVLKDNRVSVMTGGSVTDLQPEAEARKSFIARFRKVKAACGDGLVMPILPTPSGRKAVVNSWEFLSLRSNELLVRCTSTEVELSPIVIKDDIASIVYTGSKSVTLTPKVVLSPEFSTGWALQGAGGRRSMFRAQIQRKRVQELAFEIWDTHLKEAKANPREALVNLRSRAQAISECLEFLDESRIDVLIYLKDALKAVRESVLEDRRLSTFELSVSGLVPTFVQLLEFVHKYPSSMCANMFIELFGTGNALAALIHKIVLVLESNENFPQFLYDTPGGSPFGLQLLSRRFRLSLEHPNPTTQNHLLNYTNRILKSEPLTTIGQIRSFLLSKLTKQWFDRERPTFEFVKRLQAGNKFFNYDNDFDTRGIIYFIGTNGYTTEWINPALCGVVKVTSSEAQLPFGQPEDVLSRDANAINCHTSDDKNAHFTIHMGVMVVPTMYTLRHARGYGKSALRNWIFQGSRDGEKFEDILMHTNDTSLNEPGSTASWQIEPGKGPFKLFRIQQNGPNSSGQTFYLSLSGFEVYGVVVGVITENFKIEDKPSVRTGPVRHRGLQAVKDEFTLPANAAEAISFLPLKEENNRIKYGIPYNVIFSEMRQARMKATRCSMLENIPRMQQDSFEDGADLRGLPVRRASDWHWGDQNAGVADGRIVSLIEGGWVDVIWENMYVNSYRYGYDGKFDVTKSPMAHELLFSSSLRRAEKHNLVDVLTPMKPAVFEPNNHRTLASFSPFSLLPGKGLRSRPFRNSASRDAEPASSSSMAKKSMSTTNLIERGNAGSTSGAAMATPSAVSADSLQHQTPSFENLLSKYRVYIDRIAERNEPAENFESEHDSSTNVVSVASSRSSVAPLTEQEVSSSLSVSAPDLAAARLQAVPNDIEAREHDEDDNEDGDEDDEDTEPDVEEREDAPIEAFLPLQESSGSETAQNHNNESANSPYNFRLFESSDENLQAVIQRMANPAHISDEVEEDVFDEDLDANEDELIEEEYLPVETFANILGRDPSMRLSWRKVSQLLYGDTMHNRLMDARRERSSNRVQLHHWDDDFVLKSNFPSLIPAFDPRPGRTNINQTQDVELPPEVEASSSKKSKENEYPCNLRLYLSGPNIDGVENAMIELGNDNYTLFKYVQILMNSVEWQNKSDKTRRIFDATYTLIYEDDTMPSMMVPICEIPQGYSVPDIVNQTLELLILLARVSHSTPNAEFPANIFVTEKLTQKIIQELSDPLIVAAGALPDWCEILINHYPCLFTTETRSSYLQATAFGTSRSIVWLQSRRDAILERTRNAGTSSGAGSSTARREDAFEFRVGRLKHERIKVNRTCELMEQAVKIFNYHAERKAILEIEYHGEEGTGLGPTLEFYALVSAEMQRKSLAIWWCDDLDETQLKLEEKELDLGEGKKPPGYYVRRAGGLFPAPLPPGTNQLRNASETFRTLGIFLAKVLQDGRLVDIPLSQPFLKLLTHPKVNSNVRITDLDGVLTLDDFVEVHPVKGRFLKELSSLAMRKRAIECDETLEGYVKRRKFNELHLNLNGTRCKIEDLGLNFTVNPSSAIFDYQEFELIDGGCDTDVTMDNVELYVEKCTDFYLNSGIIDQIRAFREGFDRVFPLQFLRCFSPDEVECLISGEQNPEWTREDVLNYTEPKLGYTRDSPGFLRFVDVMVGLSPTERKNFLQFATGCSSLPPGGLANLHPRLTIVRKVESGNGSYPSVNTCVHYLKLPEYSSAEILRERLLTAINEKGFHLN